MKKYYQSTNGMFMLKRTIRLILPIYLLLMALSSTMLAQSITVSTTLDEVNGNTTNIAALKAASGGAGISLREAIIATNNEPAGTTITINIPSGNYALSLAGSDNTSAAGDLDVNTTVAAGNKTVSIVGAGSTLTTITGLAGERIFDVHAENNTGSITFTLRKVKLTGGSPSSGSGGAMLTGRPGDVTNLINCTFTDNSAASNGGAISQSAGSAAHNLNVTNCTFTNNIATWAVGGAINYAGIGNVSITGCTFTNNTSGTQGGAINISGNGTGSPSCTISKNNFINNSSNGSTFGGAVVGMVNVQAMNINYNRIVGNNGANVSTGKVMTAGGGTVGSMDLTNNWWGVNTGPNGSSDIRGTVPSSWLQLKASASPTPICPSATSVVTSSFLSNNLSSAINASDLTALVGVAVSFVNHTLGSISNAQTIIQNSGTANATFTAGNSTGMGGVNAVVDNVSGSDIIARASILIPQLPEAPMIVASGPLTICEGDSIILSASSSNYTSFASNVINFSSEYQPINWGAIQALGAPDVYPNYGDISLAWAPLLPDGGREFIELGYANPASINFIDIYETFNPGSIDTVYVKNPYNNLFEIVYTGTAATANPAARKLHITFPLTTFPVSVIRIAMNTAVVPSWNEIDAVSIGRENNVSDFASFLWSTGETTQNIVVKNSGTFTVTGITSGGCTSTSSSSFSTNAVPLPIVDIVVSPSSTVCSGTPVTLTGSGASTYSFTGNITSGVPFTPTVTKTYYLTGVDANGCTSLPDSAKIIVNPLPTANITFTGSLSVCNGDSVLLKATVANNRSYQWLNSNIALPGETQNTYTAKSSGNYRVRIKNTNTGCSKLSSSKSVLVYALPTVNPITGNTIVCKGSTTTLSNATIGGTWSSSDTSIAIVSNTGIVIGKIFGTVTITYTTAANSNGCTNNATALVSVKSLPSISSNITGSKTACVGKTSQLSNSTIGGTWSSSNSSIAMVSNTGLVTGIGIGTVTITYTTAANNSGCTNKASTTFSVTAPCLFKADYAKSSAQQEEPLSKMEVSIFPNPAGNVFNLKVKALKQESISIRVIDVNGKTAFVTKGKPGQIFTFGEQLISGTYLVEVRQGEEVKTLKAVKVKR